jgi:hypothetical protein
MWFTALIRIVMLELMQKGSLKSSIMGLSLERKDKEPFNIMEKQKH